MGPKLNQAEFASTFFKRVEKYLDQPDRIQKGQLLIYGKAVFILALYFWTYAQLISATSFSSFLGFSILIAISQVLIPLNIVHDATHHTFSKTPWINKLGLWTMNLVGSNPILYQQMHLKSHRDKENGGHQKAIETQQLLMKSSQKKSLPFGFYLFYAFYMAFVRDFVLASKSKSFSSVGDWVNLTIPKVIYFTAIWIVPFILVPLPAWQIFVGIFSIYLMITLLLIIILLMPTDPIEVSREGEDQETNDQWLREILRHNVDFSPRSFLLTFIVGGANMNVIHYIFPKINHVHYVGLSKILEETTAEYHLTYRRQNIGKVFGIHWRYMMDLGKVSTEN